MEWSPGAVEHFRAAPAGEVQRDHAMIGREHGHVLVEIAPAGRARPGAVQEDDRRAGADLVVVQLPALGLDRATLAQKASVDQTTLWRIETGKIGGTIDTWRKLLAALDDYEADAGSREIAA